MSNEDQALRKAIIAFYRDEIAHRYQVENIRRFKEFDPISEAEIDALREYFLHNIYPPPDKRQALDDAFDNLNAMLKSPARIKPLLKTAFTSIFKLGAQIPSAIAAGRSTVDAYMETRKLEGSLYESAVALHVTAKDKDKREKMVRLVSNVPEKEVKRLIYDILSLFKALSNVKLLRLTVDIMNKSLAIMEKNPKVYSESECDGLKLGLAVVVGGLQLFEGMKEEHFAHVLAGIEVVELDWFERILKEAENAG